MYIENNSFTYESLMSLQYYLTLNQRVPAAPTKKSNKIKRL
jgi:hypothetical protein